MKAWASLVGCSIRQAVFCGAIDGDGANVRMYDGWFHGNGITESLKFLVRIYASGGLFQYRFELAPVLINLYLTKSVQTSPYTVA